MQVKQGYIIEMKELKIGEIAVIIDNCILNGQLVTPIPKNELFLLLGRKECPCLIDPIKFNYDCLLLRKGDTITI